MDLDAGRLVAFNVSVDLPASLLADSDHAVSFIKDLISKIGMEPLAPPQVFAVPANHDAIDDQIADDGGITVQCVISTSHVAFHSWPLQGRFRLVVDSCKDFDADAVYDLMAEWYPVKRYSCQDMQYVQPTTNHRDTNESTVEIAS